MEVTKETWDLAELKWYSFAQGAYDPEELHPELEKETASCAFCTIFSPLKCEGCLLSSGPRQVFYENCCDGLYGDWEDNNESRKSAGAVLRYIRARRKEWENSQ